MKKILTLLFLLALALSVVVACRDGAEGGDETTAKTDAVTTDAVTTEETTKEPETEAPVTLEGADGVVIDDTDLHGWFDYGSALCLRDKFVVGERDDIAISMAKNEKEGFQYILAAGLSYDDLRCELSVLTDGNGNSLEGTVYVAYDLFIRKAAPYNYSRGYRPFALLEQDNPYVGGTFDVVAGRAKTLYVQYQTDANTVPGTYTGRFEIKQGDTVLTHGEVSVTVWDIYYAEKTANTVMFGVGYTLWDTTQGNGQQYVGPTNAPDFKIIENGTATENFEVCEQYLDFMLEDRLAPITIPYEGGLLNEKAAKYLEDPRIRFMNVADRSNLALQYEKAEEMGWLDRVFFSEFDEPHEEWHVGFIIDEVKMLNRRFPTTLHMNPFYIDLPDGDKNIADRLGEISTLHCTLSPNLEEGNAIGESLMKLKAERGDTVIWYTCGSNPADTIDLIPFFPGTLQRTLFWQQYLYDVDGYLLWNTTNWYGQDNIWEEGYAEKRHKLPDATMGPSGNGVLIYFDPITKEPIPTLGLQSVRDGIEDYQLFAMAEEVLGREEVLTYITRITTSLTEFNSEAEVLMQVRNELAQALLSATAS